MSATKIEWGRWAYATLLACLWAAAWKWFSHDVAFVLVAAHVAMHEARSV